MSAPMPGLDEVVAVHRGRHRDRRQLGQRELQQRHLGGRVLHRDPVGPVVAVVDAALEPDRGGIVGVGEHHLLGERQRPAQPLADDREALGIAGVRRAHERDGRERFDGLSHDGLPGSAWRGIRLRAR